MNDKLKSILRKTGIFTTAAAIRLRFLQIYSYPKWHMLRRQKRVCLELGSGKKTGLNGWTTVDLSGADISHDLRRGIPLPNESVDRIYMSHMLEHMPYKELIIFIQECFRVLKKNGALSVCVPNARLYIKAYVQGSRFRPPSEGYAPAIVDTGSLIDQVNYIAYMDQHHKYMFDPENLVNTLKKVPFSEVRLRQFDEMLDLKSRDFESIYASAIK